MVLYALSAVSIRLWNTLGIVFFNVLYKDLPKHRIKWEALFSPHSSEKLFILLQVVTAAFPSSGHYSKKQIYPEEWKSTYCLWRSSVPMFCTIFLPPPQTSTTCDAVYTPLSRQLLCFITFFTADFTNWFVVSCGFFHWMLSFFFSWIIGRCRR